MIVFVGEHVHKPVESRAHIDRELDIDKFLAHSFLEGRLHTLPVGLVSVKLVDGHHEREFLV